MRVENVDSMPFSLWGKLKRSFGGWNLSARFDSSSDDLNTWGVDLRAVGAGGSTALQATGAASLAATYAEVSNLKLTQKVNGLGGSWTLIPRFNVRSRKADMTVAYAIEDTVVIVDAASNKQKVTINQRIGENNAVSPSITTDGEVDFEYRRSLASGSLSATVKPNDSINLKWEDGPWEANFKVPMEGFHKLRDHGVKVNVRRNVDVPSFY